MDGKASGFALLAAFVLFCLPLASRAQQQPAANGQAAGAQTPASAAKADTFDNKLEAGDEDDPQPARRLVSWNEFHGKYLTVKVGGGFLYEYDAYAQDQASKEQFSLFAT